MFTQNATRFVSVTLILGLVFATLAVGAVVGMSAIAVVTEVRDTLALLLRS